MSAFAWRILGALAVSTGVVLAIAWCAACNGAPAFSPSDVAEKACIDQAEAGVGRAALKKAIDDCRSAARDGGMQ